MTIRMKAKFYFYPKGQTPETYDPLADIEPGTQLYKERLELTRLYREVQKQDEEMDEEEEEENDTQERTSPRRAYLRAKTALFAALANDKRKTAPVILSMDLKHGDMVVMHGHPLQARYEVRSLPPPSPSTPVQNYPSLYQETETKRKRKRKLTPPPPARRHPQGQTPLRAHVPVRQAGQHTLGGALEGGLWDPGRGRVRRLARCGFCGDGVR